MDTILFFQNLNSNPGRQRMEGLSAFAREIGWNIQCQSNRLDADAMGRLSEFWHPVGAILGSAGHGQEYDVSMFSPETTVLQDCFPRKGMERYTIVTTDSAAVTELAMKELLTRNCASYGFIPWQEPRLWSENRRIHFKRVCGALGLDAHVFVPLRTYYSAGDMQKDVAEWLKGLPRPIGLLTANDIVGYNVLNACRVAGLSVPFDCAVVGIADDETLCKGSNPTLTSVSLNYREAGYHAGELLYRLVKGKMAEKPIVAIPPIGLTRRGSSRVFLQTDNFVLKASELIHAKACDGLRAKDVLAVFPCSRRLAEIRFRKATGRSVLEEIRAARIAKAKQLLANPYRDLSAVASMCGYESDTTFRRVFREETGMTMREWRDKARQRRALEVSGKI